MNRTCNINSLTLYFSTCTFMVLIMVVIGGLTRLTGSGLSIVEWKPITGIFPPLSDLEWIAEFDKYRHSPEFLKVNSHMTLEGFKSIFWLEYIHRIFARITGLVFFLPAIIFWQKDALTNSAKNTIILAGLLGIAQGFMGWYMVKSGLQNSPYVSHFRLSMHLILALALYLLLLNGAITEYLGQSRHKLFVTAPKRVLPSWMIYMVLGLLMLQIFLGGMVAGLKAGLIYNSFPYMGESFIPEELGFISYSGVALSLRDPVLVQFLHRVTAYIVSLAILLMVYRLVNQGHYKTAIALILCLLAQFLLGVFTLLYNVPIALASLHQLFAFILAGVVLVISRCATTRT